MKNRRFLTPALAGLLALSLAAPPRALALRALEPGENPATRQSLTTGLEEEIPVVDLRQYRSIGMGDMAEVYLSPDKKKVVKRFRYIAVEDSHVRRYAEMVNGLPETEGVTVPRLELVKIMGDPPGDDLGIQMDFVGGETLKELIRQTRSIPYSKKKELEREEHREVRERLENQEYKFYDLGDSASRFLDTVDRLTGGLADRHIRDGENLHGPYQYFDLESTLANFIVPEEFLFEVKSGLDQGFNLKAEAFDKAPLVAVDPINISTLEIRMSHEEWERAKPRSGLEEGIPPERLREIASALYNGIRTHPADFSWIDLYGDVQDRHALFMPETMVWWLDGEEPASGELERPILPLTREWAVRHLFFANRIILNLQIKRRQEIPLTTDLLRKVAEASQTPGLNEMEPEKVLPFIERTAQLLGYPLVKTVALSPNNEAITEKVALMSAALIRKIGRSLSDFSGGQGFLQIRPAFSSVSLANDPLFNIEWIPLGNSQTLAVALPRGRWNKREAKRLFEFPPGSGISQFVTIRIDEIERISGIRGAMRAADLRVQWTSDGELSVILETANLAELKVRMPLLLAVAAHLLVSEGSPAAGLEERLEQVKGYLGVKDLQPDQSMDMVVEVAQDLIVLRGDSSRKGWWLSMLSGGRYGQMRERPQEEFPPGIYSNAATERNTGPKGGTPLDLSRKILEMQLRAYPTLGQIVYASQSGRLRQEGRDPFISLSRSFTSVLDLVSGTGMPQEAVFVVKIPKGRQVIDQSWDPEQVVLLPHWVPREWIIAVITNNQDFYRDLQNPALIQDWGGRIFFEGDLNGETLSKRLVELGLKEKDFLPGRAFRETAVNLQGEEVRSVKLDLEGKPLMAVYAGQTLEEAIRNYPRLHQGISQAPEQWFFHRSLEDGSRQEVSLDTLLDEGFRITLERRFSGTESTRSGLEETDLDRTLESLATVMQDSRVLAVEAAEVSRRVGLEEFLARLPRGIKTVVLGAGSAAGLELAARAGVRYVSSDRPVDWAAALAGLEEDRITFVGDRAAGELLSRILPPSMEVSVLGPGSGLEEVLRSLGLPATFLEEINAAGLEERLARERAA